MVAGLALGGATALFLLVLLARRAARDHAVLMTVARGMERTAREAIPDRDDSSREGRP